MFLSDVREVFCYYLSISFVIDQSVSHDEEGIIHLSRWLSSLQSAGNLKRKQTNKFITVEQRTRNNFHERLMTHSEGSSDTFKANVQSREMECNVIFSLS